MEIINYTDKYYKISRLTDNQDKPYKIFGDNTYFYFIYDNYLIVINPTRNNIRKHSYRVIYDDYYKKDNDKIELQNIFNTFYEVKDELDNYKNMINMINIDIICNNVILNTAKEFQKTLIRNAFRCELYYLDDLNEYEINTDNYLFIMTPQHYFNKLNMARLSYIVKDCKCFFYFMEQISSRKNNTKINTKFNNQYNELTKELMKSSVLSFDYNKDNFKYFDDINYLPPPVITNNNTCDKIYDILFIGLINEFTRRKAILENLQRFFKIKIVYDEVGDGLTKIINQSKVVLNLHFYDNDTLLEEVRLNEIINSDTHILSELPHIDIENMTNKYSDRVTFINIIEKPKKPLKKSDPIVKELKNLLKKPNKKYDHNFNNDLTEKILIEDIKNIIKKYNKFNKYPHLFHKYLLKIKDPELDIKYQITNAINYKNIRYFTHLHCYDIAKFHEIYDEYLEKIDKYFNIIITYSIGEIKDIDYTIIKIPNKGMDVGAKFCMIKYLNDNNLEYDYVMFLHSKTDPKQRKKYFQIVDDLDDEFMNNIQDNDSYFPDIKWKITNRKLKMISGNPEHKDTNWPERNSLYRNEILKYLNCDNDTNIFTEGNVYILKNTIINKLFTDKYLYNILNEPGDFDYNWITYRYGIKGDIKKVYDEFKTKKLKPSDEKSYDGYIEHVFERIVMNLCENSLTKIPLIKTIKDNDFKIMDYNVNEQSYNNVIIYNSHYKKYTEYVFKNVFNNLLNHILNDYKSLLIIIYSSNNRFDLNIYKKNIKLNDYILAEDIKNNKYDFGKTVIGYKSLKYFNIISENYHIINDSFICSDNCKKMYNKWRDNLKGLSFVGALYTKQIKDHFQSWWLIMDNKCLEIYINKLLYFDDLKYYLEFNEVHLENKLIKLVDNGYLYDSGRCFNNIFYDDDNEYFKKKADGFNIIKIKRIQNTPVRRILPDLIHTKEYLDIFI